MSNTSKNEFSIGDFITDFEDIYEIFAVKTEKDYHGNNCQYFLYRSITPEKKSASFSIPVDNILKSGLRRLIEKDDVKEIYQYLKEPLDSTEIFDFKTIKEILYLNNPHKTIYILKQLNANKATTGEKFSKNYQETINEIISHLSKEIAFITKVSSESIEKKIRSLI